MFKKATAVIFLAVLTPWIFHPSLHARHNLTKEEISYLKKKETVVFVSHTVCPPFEFKQTDGTRNGMCVELARWMATEYGFKVTFVDASFSQAQQLIFSGDADVLTNFFYSHKRDERYDFTDTIFYVPGALFISTSRLNITRLEDLNNKSIAIQEGDFAEEFLRLKGISFVMKHAGDFSQAAHLVLKGEADAIIGNEQVIRYYLYKDNLEKEIVRVGKPLYMGKNSMAVLQGNKLLLSILNKGIADAREEGVLKSINTKWLGTSLPDNDPYYYRYRWIVVGIMISIVILLAVVAIWNFSLRRVLAKQTGALQNNESFLLNIFDNLPNMVFVKNANDLTFARLNRAGEELLGMEQSELLGKSDYDFFPKEQAHSFIENDRAVLTRKKLVDIPAEKIMTPLKGSRILHTKKIPIMDPEGNPLYLLGISEDITEKLKAEQEREENGHFIQEAMDAFNIGFLLFNEEDRLVICSNKYKDIYPGLKDILIPGTTYTELYEAFAQSDFGSEDSQEKSLWLRNIQSLHEEAQGSRVLTLAKRKLKITERKISRGRSVTLAMELSDSGKREYPDDSTEDETVLRNVHRGVETNMRAISNIFTEQSSRIEDKSVVNIFTEASSKIHAMALAHETLYQSKETSLISARDYLGKLVDALSTFPSVTENPVTFNIEAGDVFIPINDAVPFGLIVTEIVTNSLKYAFLPNTQGTIDISVLKRADGYEMEISDNGKGLDTEFDPSSILARGIRHIDDIVTDQLKGQWSLKGKNGVIWFITWNERTDIE